MAKQSPRELAGLWIVSLKDTDSQAVHNAYIRDDPARYRERKDDFFFEWAAKKYAREIQMWLESSTKGPGGRPLAEELLASFPSTPPPAPSSIPASPNGVSQAGAAFASSSAVPPPTPNYPLPPNYPQVPYAMRGMFNPPAPPFVGSPSPASAPLANHPSASSAPPPRPSQPGGGSYQSPRQYGPDTYLASAISERQQAAKANLRMDVRQSLEAEEQRREYDRIVHIETMKRKGQSIGGLLGSGGAKFGGGIGESIGELSGTMGALKAGPAGMLATGVMKSIEMATKGVNLTNTLIDASRDLKMAKFAATPLEEAQKTAAAQEKIPIIGKLMAGLTELASSGWKAHYALRDMAANLHESNVNLGRFSFEMAQVAATRTVKDIERSMKVGQMLAPSASGLRTAEDMLKDAMIPIETARKTKQNADAADEALDEAEGVLHGRLATNKAEFGEDSEEYAEVYRELQHLIRTRKNVEKMRKTGKWEGDDNVSYEDTLPGWMDGARDRYEEAQKKGRPPRFGS